MRKKQADTAIAVYEQDIKPTLGRRQTTVRVFLSRCFSDGGQWPTALELLNYICARTHEVFDVNSVRPRLKELLDKGLVAKGEKRKCRVSGKRVTTWMLATPTATPKLF